MSQQTKQSTIDADYFSAVDTFLRDQDGLEVSNERRRSQRYDYPAEAMIAFCSGQDVPPINWFESVLCRDISCGGFAFYSSDPPQQDHLVVTFCRKMDYLSLFARVVHSQHATLDDEPHFVIGCEFTGRVKFDPQSSAQ